MPHQPERTCIGCRRVAPKMDLLRVAATPDGVRVDRTGGLPGRGVYLHRSAECVRHAIRRGALNRSLRASMSDEEASNLLREIEREGLETKE